MSKIEVDTIAPQSGTTITIGESGDTVTLGSGATQTGFGSANIEDNGTATAITIDSSNNVEVSNDLKFNSGYGSVATAYGCRAWVNFNGTGTVAIRDSGNVSSITDNGTGDYTVNFATAMPDSNYSTTATVSGSQITYTGRFTTLSKSNPSPNSIRIVCGPYNAEDDALYANVAIFR